MNRDSLKASDRDGKTDGKDYRHTSHFAGIAKSGRMSLNKGSEDSVKASDRDGKTDGKDYRHISHYAGIAESGRRHISHYNGIAMKSGRMSFNKGSEEQRSFGRYRSSGEKEGLE